MNLSSSGEHEPTLPRSRAAQPKVRATRRRCQIWASGSETSQHLGRGNEALAPSHTGPCCVWTDERRRWMTDSSDSGLQDWGLLKKKNWFGACKCHKQITGCVLPKRLICAHWRSPAGVERQSKGWSDHAPHRCNKRLRDVFLLEARICTENCQSNLDQNPFHEHPLPLKCPWANPRLPTSPGDAVPTLCPPCGITYIRHVSTYRGK